MDRGMELLLAGAGFLLAALSLAVSESMPPLPFVLPYPVQCLVPTEHFCF